MGREPRLEIANATTSIDGDLTNIDISDNINGFDAFFGALDNGDRQQRTVREPIRVPATVFDQHVPTVNCTCVGR
jgi:hypothetical protein